MHLFLFCHGAEARVTVCTGGEVVDDGIDTDGETVCTLPTDCTDTNRPDLSCVISC